ncbi:hypothetical protein FALCPG4_010959 [Fusarium falciforme]
MASSLQAHNMNANYTECSRQQSQHVPETELPPHPPFAQPRLQQEIRRMVVPRKTSKDIESEQHKSMHKLKHHRKVARSDLRAAFMANQLNNEPLEQLLESSMFAGPRKQTSKQGRSTTPMGEPQSKSLGTHQPTSTSQRAPRGTQHAGPPASSQGPSFRQRVEATLYEWHGKRSQPPFVQTCNTPSDEVLHWNKHGIRQHAGLGNQTDRKSECNKAQREALFPPPLVMLPMTWNSQTSFGEDEEVQRSETRIPIGCKGCEKLREHREANNTTERELTERNGALDHVHIPCRNTGRLTKASMKGLWSLLRHRRLYRRFHSILQGLHGDAQPLFLGKFQNDYQLSLMARSRG